LTQKHSLVAGSILIKLDEEHNEMKEFLDVMYAGYLDLIQGNTRAITYQINRESDRAIVPLALKTGLRTMGVPRS
jgi:hypothetical protein